MTLTDVTKKLQVTRQTVYRYFPGIDALLAAVALDIGLRLSDKLVSEVGDISEPAEAIVELMATTIETIRDDRAVMYLMTTAVSSNFAGTMTDQTSQAFAVAILRRLNVDWSAVGFTDQGLAELTSWLLLIADAFVSGTSTPLSTGSELRNYLSTWLAPSINETVRAAAAAMEASHEH